MGRRDHTRAFGQFLDRRQRRLDAIFGVEKKERSPRVPLTTSAGAALSAVSDILPPTPCEPALFKPGRLF
jgi:hypothetical protein